MSGTKKNRGGARGKSMRRKSVSRKSVSRSLQPTFGNLSYAKKSTKRVKNIPAPSMGRHGWEILSHKAARNRRKKITRRNVHRALFPERRRKPRQMNVIPEENLSMVFAEPEHMGRPRRQAALRVQAERESRQAARQEAQAARQQAQAARAELQQENQNLARLMGTLSMGSKP